MICQKCGNTFNGNEFCPFCGERVSDNNVPNEAEYSETVEDQSPMTNAGMNEQPIMSNNGMYGQPVMSNNGMNGQPVMPNNGMYGQPMMPNNGMNGQPMMPNNGMNGQQPMMFPGTQYQQYAGKYCPGLSKLNLFKFPWLRKYNTAIMVLSIIMYILQAFMMISLFISMAYVSSYSRYFSSRYQSRTMAIYIFSITLVLVLLILSIVGHNLKSSVASGFVMGFYVLSIIATINSGDAVALIFAILIFGVATAIFVLDIIYNSKWRAYRDSGIIPAK